MKQPLKYFFIVQGEGHGHMTQAIALKERLENAGQEVVCVMIGRNTHREIPTFFYDRIQMPVFSFESPTFITDSQNKSSLYYSSIFAYIKQLPSVAKSLKFIDQKVKEHNPDIIINFCDLICGFYFLIYNPKNVKHICVGHQYFILHSKFKFSTQKLIQNLLMRALIRTTSSRAEKKLALSFREEPPDVKQKIIVVPPLIRNEILSLSIKKENFILCYVVNDGYGEEIVNWHKLNPQIKVHCFWDKKDALEESKIHPNLIFHKIDDKKFLHLLSGCEGFATTAGFESVCEAMYLGKPLMMVPAHIEQTCNAHDACMSGAGIQNDTFNLTPLMQYIPNHKGNDTFKNWIYRADELILKHLID